MRNRNNRIAVRVTNKEFDRINEMASKSIFPKEKMLRIIVDGYPIQEKPSDDCMLLFSALRKLATDIFMNASRQIPLILLGHLM